jgi:hypothetical protein
MVRPASFQFNIETAISNAFQQTLEGVSEREIREKAIEEFDQYVNKLRAHHIHVIVVQDNEIPAKPDAVFPNNWISMQQNGMVYLYPMNTPNRRLERRDEVLDEIEQSFEIKQVIDISDSENYDQFLEGTGSIIFDHINKVGYACISPRTDKDLFIAHCELLGYSHIYFHSSDSDGNLVYHTNVMLTIGSGYAIICSESIREEEEQTLVMDKLQSSGHEIITISEAQMNDFAGNMLEVVNKEGQRYLVMSTTAHQSLTAEQIEKIENYAQILSVSIPTIETIGGGSARCMLAEIFLKKK